MAENERKPAVCTDRYATAELIIDSKENLTYGDVVEVSTTLITMNYAPKMNNAEMYASGVAAESYVAKSGGTADVVVVGLNAEDENRYFGSTIRGDGLVISNKNDVVPDRMIIWSTRSSSGKKNFYKIFKAKFMSQGESAETTDANGVKFNGTKLKAEYANTIFNGDDMAFIKGVDTSTPEGAALEEAWFATALGGIALAAVITPAEAVFDLNSSSVNNRNILLRLENSTLSAVKNGENTLTAGTDYVYNSTDGTVTLLRTYLGTLAVSAVGHAITLETADETNPVAKIVVVNTSA